MLAFLFWILLILVILILLSMFILYFLKINIDIKELEINYERIEDKRYTKIKGNIQGNLFGKIKIFKINFNLDNKNINRIIKDVKVSKLYEKIKKNEKFDIKAIKLTREYIREYKERFKYNPIEIKNINLDLQIGLLNIEITTAIVIFLSTILSVGLSLLNNKNSKYRIFSNYNQSDILKIKLKSSGIITINLMHIINILFKFLIERRKSNDRKSSNRRFNEYSYE